MSEKNKNKDFLANLRSMDVSQIEQECKKLEEDVFELRFKLGSKQLSDTASYKRTRRKLAMAKTIHAEKLG